MHSLFKLSTFFFKKSFSSLYDVDLRLTHRIFIQYVFRPRLTYKYVLVGLKPYVTKLLVICAHG